MLMTNRSISIKQQEFNDLLSRWKKFYNDDATILFKLLIKHGVSRQEIKTALGAKSLTILYQKFGGES